MSHPDTITFEIKECAAGYALYSKVQTRFGGVLMLVAVNFIAEGPKERIETIKELLESGV